MTNNEMDMIAKKQAEYLVAAIKADTELQDLLFPPRLMSIEEAADFLRIPVATLYCKINSVPHRKFGRRLLFSDRELMRWINSNQSASEIELKPAIRKVM